MDREWLLGRILLLVPLILSLTVHEWAHAWSAMRLGDDTAEQQGRLTLNPIAHIDPIGTLLLPLLGIPFGWARPVPVNPIRFRRSISMRTGMLITAAAGPVSNLVLAISCATVYGVLIRFHIQMSDGVQSLLQLAIVMNVGLAVFNLLPFPPLDGSRVVDGLMPERYRPQWETFMRFGSLGLLIVIFAGSRFLSGPIGFITGMVFKLIYMVGGA